MPGACVVNALAGVLLLAFALHASGKGGLFSRLQLLLSGLCGYTALLRQQYFAQMIRKVEGSPGAANALVD